MSEAQAKTLEVENLHVHYKETCAVRDVTFMVNGGNSVAVVGRNGAGKSTLLKSLAGLIPDAAGTIRWNGQPLNRNVKREGIAYLPQREEVDWNFPLTVRGLVDMGLYPQVGAFGRFKSSHKEASEKAISKLGLEGLENRRIGELSGGQQQRAFLARALAGGASVLLLDEPFAGLDVEANQNLARIIQQLTKEGSIVIASHHDLRSIPETFTNTLLLRTKQLAFGPSAKVLSAERIREAFA